MQALIRLVRGGIGECEFQISKVILILLVSGPLFA